MRFRTLLFFAIVVPLALTAAAVIAAVFHNAERRSSEMGERLLRAATSRAAQQTHEESKHAADLTRSLASLSDGGLALEDADRLLVQLVGLLRANPGITWISFSNPDGSFTGAHRDAEGRTCTNQSRIVEGKTTVDEFVVGDDGTKTLLRHNEDSGYDPRRRPFYIEAIRSPEIVWLPPYIFYGQGIPGISCAMAVRAPNRNVRGVFSVDYDLNRLSTFAREIAATQHSEVMVFTPENALIAHSTAHVVSASDQRGNGTLLTLANIEDPPTRAFFEEFRKVGLPEASKVIPFRHEGKRFIGCVMPVRLEAGPNQYVATVAPLSDFAPSAMEFSRAPIVITCVALVMAALAAIYLANRISAPLSALVRASERIGAGDLNINVYLGPLREFRSLTDAFHVMLQKLRDWVRIRTSLDLAMEIQKRLLPSAPPKISGFDIAGYSAYCDETGGDYYDFIMIEHPREERFVVALGDVMGHGLPSALLMAGARGILRSSISVHTAPGAVLTHLNSLLFQDTGGKRFMTLCLASFDIHCAGCVWASAGHDPPMIYDPTDQVFQEPEGGDVPLGVIDKVEYGSYRFGPLSSGQIIVFSSDGVWETFSPSGAQYGKDRLKQVIRENGEESAEEIKRAILRSLEEFRGDAPAKDDVTFVVIKECHVRVGPVPPSEGMN